MIPALLLGYVQATSLERTALVEGVDSLIAPGALPGAVVASKNAFVVLRIGDAPAFVASKVGTGRVEVGGHGGFFSSESLKNPSNAKFFSNSLAWLGGRSVSGMRVGQLGMGGLAAGARKAGADVVAVDKGNLSAGLLGVDVLCLDQGALDGDDAAQSAVVAWVKSGHGLLVTGPAWGWAQLHPGKSVRTDLSVNRMLLPYGLGLSGDTADGTAVSAGADDPLLQTDNALVALRKGGLTGPESVRATRAVSRALSLSDLDDRGLVAEIERLAAAENVPAGTSITEKTPFSRLQTILDYRAWEEEAPAKVRANRNAASFPGPVPKEAKRITRTVFIDTKVPQWHGTGLYAAPGEVVHVKLPESAAGKGIGIRIGSHTDELWDLNKWDRSPAISRRWSLDKTETTAASPFGGTVFIDVPDNCSLGIVSVSIGGAVPAPRFVRGVTKPDEWTKMITEPGGPWAELEGYGVILSVPRYAVTDLKDPDALMAFWDETINEAYKFFAAPRRPRQERYCVDRQISAGYMHSGYPIMTWEDVAKTFTNVALLRGKGKTWGFFHELGHNFQEEAWTFSGTGEVTNNLFSLYGSEKLNGGTPPDYGDAHGAMRVEERKRRLDGYLAKGAHFSDWQNDPFLALTMYAQMREAFGWEPFTKVFAEYRRNHENPRGDLAKHDAWMVHMSKATGKNLGPFFVAWGVPTSETARKSIADLPGWMPADWPK